MKKTRLLLHKRILSAVLSGGMLLLPNWGYALPQGNGSCGKRKSRFIQSQRKPNEYHRQRQCSYRLEQL